ncbi:hypothetical protein MKX03_001699 [Papaver bracteatum]|nr:hypothetical protein MKX03_001699 [Papaver bracteatum]
MKRVSFEKEFNGKFISEDKSSSFYEKMKDTVVKICVCPNQTEANHENEVKETQNQYASTRQARKEAAHEVLLVERGSGTGVIVKEGYILTAHHVVVGDVRVFIRNTKNNDYYSCSVVSSNAERDLALLKIERRKVEFTTKQVKLAPGNNAIIGSQALHIGHPNDYNYSILRGAVAHPRRFCNGEKASEFHVNNLHGAGGSSGGPVFDANGFLIGTLISVQNHTGLIICAHMDVIRDFLVENLPEQFFFRLTKLFGECGKMLRIFFPLDKTTKKRKRFLLIFLMNTGNAFIEFEDKEGVDKALLKNGKRLFGKDIKVTAV